MESLERIGAMMHVYIWMDEWINGWMRDDKMGRLKGWTVMYVDRRMDEKIDSVDWMSS